MSEIAKAHSFISDEEIVRLYWRRDDTAIRETDRKYGTYLHSIAWNILRDELDCEECKNDAYLGVWNAIPPTKPASFRAFLTQIMRRVAINRYRKNSVKRLVPPELTVVLEECGDLLTDGSSVDDALAAQELGRIISGYVRGLPDRQRYVFVGRFFMAQPVDRLAKELGVTASAVYKELDKLKRGLKEHLERNGITV